MDTFMDKLAQKLTAQEMIKANVAAETEELVQLRKQLAEYNACLEKFRRLVDEGAEKLRGSWANVAVEDGSGEKIGEEITRIVEESLQKVQVVQQDAEGLEELGKRLEDAVREAVEAEMKGQLAEELGAQVENQVEGALNRQLEGRIEGALSRQLEGQIEGALSRQLESQIEGALSRQLGSQLEGALSRQLEGKVENVLSRQLESQIEGVLSRQLEGQVEGVLSRQLEGKVEGALRSQLHSQLEGTLKGQLESTLKGQLQSQLDSVLRRQLPGQLENEFDKLLGAQAEAIEASLGGRSTDVNDAVHKECVKVYRNVQAVVVEEGEKQKGITTGLAEDVRAVNGKMGAILGVSVAALIFSLASAAIQILNVLNVKLF